MSVIASFASRASALVLASSLLACGADTLPGAMPDAAVREGEDGSVDAAPPGVPDARTAEPDARAAVPLDGSPPPPPVPACAASAVGRHPTGTDKFVQNTGKSAVDALTYTNVGAAGAYARVVSGWTKATGCVADDGGALCRSTYREEKHVDAALAPFDEDQTMVFGGPIELYRIAVYSPRDGAWQRDAYWDRCSTQGLVFAGNKHWYECNGFVWSYVNEDGTKESGTPVQFAGSVAAGTEVHVTADALCGATDDCGFSPGLPLRGFHGDAQGSKMFVTELRMPLGDKTPAYWILPTQVIRSSQYGCNCRGQGSDATYKGGCGELDVAEILGGVTTSLEATTTLYSFQDITGGGSVTFARPVHETATFVVIFDAGGRQIAIRRLSDEFAFDGALDKARVDALLADKGTVRALE